MIDILKKLIKGKRVTETDIRTELEMICLSVHSQCDSECPVYEKNGDKFPWNKNRNSCHCFRDGRKMLAFIRGSKISS